MNSLHKTLTLTKTLVPLRLSALFSSSNYHDTNFQSMQPIQAQNDEENPKIDGDIPNWPRLSEIPFQPKVANLINFIGSVRVPVKFVRSPDGKSWAGTVISQDQKFSSMPLLWIPIIFEGDLAHTAATHLRVLDSVYVAGQLSRDPLPIELKNDRVDVQIKVHDIHFVGGNQHTKKDFANKTKRLRTPQMSR